MTEYVRGLEQVDATMLAAVGGKGANLGELSRISGIRVPEGFCVTTDAYAEVIGRNAQLTGLLDELSRLGAADVAGIRTSSERIREAIESTPVPAAIAEQIGVRLDELGASDAYAVRSSATAEDLPTASFAGQQDTYLNVIGTEAVLEHVRRCWASLFTERAVAYRLQHSIDHREVRLAVVVQRMVFPEVAGIMFTADPVTSNRKAVSIDAGLGLGETLVSGLANADNYTVQDGAILRRAVAAQAITVRAVPGGGTEEVAIEPERQGTQKLTDAQILRLAGIGRTIEAHFGRPQDIEWTLAGDRFAVVQSRPITTLFPIPGPQDGKNHVYMSFGHQQMMTDAMTPLGMSFFQNQFADTPLIEAGGRLYIDMAPDLASLTGRRIVQATMKSIDPLIDSAIRDLMKRDGFMKNLSRDGERYLKLNGGGGYFTWRLPVEGVKLYRSNNPDAVTALRAEHDATLERIERQLGALSGDELFPAILDALNPEMKDEVIDPRSMAVVYVGMYALNWVNKHMEKWLAVKGAGDVLLTSVANDVTADMGLALLDVADTVRNHPAVLAALPTLTDSDFFAELSPLEGGDAVARSIRDFLRLYGMRCSGEIDVTRPRWSEAPTTLVPMILSTIRNLEPNARAARVERISRETEEFRANLLERLERLPGGRRKATKTSRMITRLRNFSGYREYPKYLMMRHYWIIKQSLLREAARLVDEGVVERVEDVYYLSFEEFREAVRTRAVDAGLIARRRREFEAWERLTPPRVITSAGEVPAGTYDRSRVPEGALAGVPVSGGTVEGRARIVRDLADAALETGDILVATFTDPSWTPVFLSVKAVVTEVGGAMTHGAVVAREYGLPAVVGVDGATRLIRDGQRIRVNGTDGYVELL
jgi:pyruvate,water dikinase